MLGFFFRHYDRIVDKYIFYDDGSTDSTLQILAAHPRVEVRQLNRPNPDSIVLSSLAVFDHDWKNLRGRADWVIIVDCDEHVMLKRIGVREYLQESKDLGVTAIPAIGYQAVSEQFPTADETLCETHTIAAPNAYMNKLVIFDPNALTETNFAVGRHSASPTGTVRYPALDEMMLVHYKNLNFEQMNQRQADISKRRGTLDKQNGWGRHYFYSREKRKQLWDDDRERAIDIAAPDFQSWQTFAPPLWWRTDKKSAFANRPTVSRRLLFGGLLRRIFGTNPFRR